MYSSFRKSTSYRFTPSINKKQKTELILNIMAIAYLHDSQNGAWIPVTYTYTIL